MISELEKYHTIEWNEFTDFQIIQTLTTNTKTRRIGYLKLLASFFLEKKKISKSIISSEFESYSQKFKNHLLNYKNSKGIIDVTSSGSSAKPYIELSKSLSLINLSNNRYSPGKSFQVYKECKDLWGNELFLINGFDRMYFFSTIFDKDFFFLRLILECIYELGYLSYSELKENFYQFLKKRINYLNKNIHSRSVLKKNLTVENRIKQWEKPDIYLEHVLMPRLNWLYDLGLIELGEDLSISKNKEGNKFYNYIKFWDKKINNIVVNCSSIFKYDFLKIYHNVYRNTIEINSFDSNNKEHAKYLINLIDICFKKFSTIAPNRVTLSQVEEYVKFNLYWNYRLVIDTIEFRKLLKQGLKDLYIYKYLPKYQEGYIQKID